MPVDMNKISLGDNIAKGEKVISSFIKMDEGKDYKSRLNAVQNFNIKADGFFHVLKDLTDAFGSSFDFYKNYTNNCQDMNDLCNDDLINLCTSMCGGGTGSATPFQLQSMKQMSCNYYAVKNEDQFENFEENEVSQISMAALIIGKICKDGPKAFSGMHDNLLQNPTIKALKERIDEIKRQLKELDVIVTDTEEKTESLANRRQLLEDELKLLEEEYKVEEEKINKLLAYTYDLVLVHDKSKVCNEVVEDFCSCPAFGEYQKICNDPCSKTINYCNGTEAAPTSGGFDSFCNTLNSFRPGTVPDKGIKDLSIIAGNGCIVNPAQQKCNELPCNYGDDCTTADSPSCVSCCTAGSCSGW